MMHLSGTLPPNSIRLTMKKIAIAIAVLLLIGAGFYVLNNIAAAEAERELDAMLAPKFKEANASYGSLAVNPSAGTVTLFDVVADEEEMTIGQVSFTSNFEDLIAAAQGTPEFLHGLKVHVEELDAKVDGEQMMFNSADLDVDGLIDLNAIAQNPAELMLTFLEQDEAHVSIKGSGWRLENNELAEEFGLPSDVLRLDALNVDLDRDGDDIDASISLESPDLGNLRMEIDGNEEEIRNFEMAIEDLDISPEERVRMQVGQSKVTASGRIPVDAIENSDPGSLLASEAGMKWSINLSDFSYTDPSLQREGLPTDRLDIRTLEHDFNFTVEQLETSLDFESNIGTVEMNLDWDIESMNPPAGMINDLKLKLTDLPPNLFMMAEALPFPMTPEGNNGLSFTFKGTLDQLMAGRN